MTNPGACDRISRPGLKPLRWGTGFMLGSKRMRTVGRNAPAAFGQTGLVNIAIWADPERGLAAGLISSGKPGSIRGQPLHRPLGPYRHRDPPSDELRQTADRSFARVAALVRKRTVDR